MINFIVWLIVGGLIGWLASMVMRTDAQQGILLNIIVGIVGALLGGFLADLLGLGQPGFGFFDLWSWILAIVGACVLLFLVGLVTGGRRRRI